MLEIGSRREFFWDDYIVDTERTTAERRLHHPIRRGSVFTFDAPWEGDGCDGFNLIFDEEAKLYRMLYHGWWMLENDADGNKIHPLNSVKNCFIDSADGIHWTRPILGKHDYDGSRENNIVCTRAESPQGRISFIMKDTNPNPAVPQKYKALSVQYRTNKDKTVSSLLNSHVSDNGIDFEYFGLVSDNGAFDTINSVHWSDALGCYVCFCRYDHITDCDGNQTDCTTEVEGHIRDIRVMYSKDFITWTKPEPLDFNSEHDFALYTNCASLYPQAEHIFVAFPTRYVDRGSWLGNYNRLCGLEARKNRYKVETRFATALTDCLFMCSRDGKSWTRYDEAFIRPGPENKYNWIYGDGYPGIGLIKTKADTVDSDDELSLYLPEKGWSGEPAELVRYTIRQDGFVSLHAGIEPKRVVTKEFTYTGDSLKINFSTSAFGYIKLYMLMDDKVVLNTDEIFGDSVNRVIDFHHRFGGISMYEGNKIKLSIEMCDADIYALQFYKA